MTAEAKEGITAQLIDEVRRHRPTPSPPDTLYHYTDAGGALGIISKGSFHATDARFMNDRTELRYSRELTGDMLQERGEKTTNELARFVLSKLIRRNEILQRSLADSVYVVSFSANDDDLPNWVAYGAAGKGYSLGFRTDGLKQFRRDTRAAELVKIVYDRRVQQGLIASVLETIVAVAEELAPDAVPSERQTVDLILAAVEALDYVGSMLKNPAFEAENEWRLVDHPLLGARSQVEFRTRSETILPYVALSPQDATILPLHEIVTGPATTEEIHSLGLRELLYAKGYGSIPVRQSNAPYRGR